VISYIFILAMFVVAAVPIAIELRRGTFDPFNLKNGFVAYYVLQLGVTGAITLWSGQPSEIGLDTVQYAGRYQEALALALGGLIAFQLGYYCFALQPPRPIRMPRAFLAEWRPGRYRAVVAAFMVFGWGAGALLIRRGGGLANFLATREEFRGGGLLGQGPLLFPATSVLAIAALVFLLGAAREARSAAWKPLSVVVLIIAILPSFVFGFRSFTVIAVLEFAVAWHYFVHRISIPTLLFGAVVFSAYFTAYGIWRAVPPDLTGRSLFDAASAAVAVHPALATSVVTRSRGTEVVATVVDRLDETRVYELGWRGIREAVTIAVPRRLWQAKPEPQSDRFATYFFGNTLALSRGNFLRDSWGGISPTVVGEFYWNFGWLGVIVGLWCMGRMARVIYATAAMYRDHRSIVVAYSVVAVSFIMCAEAVQGYVNGLVLQAIALSGTFLLLSAVLLNVTPLLPAAPSRLPAK
jgi:hypothetical protein